MGEIVSVFILFAHAYFQVHCACGCGQKFVHSNRLVKTVLVEIASVLSTVRMIQIVGSIVGKYLHLYFS